MHAPQGVGALYVRKGTCSSLCSMAAATNARAARGPRTSRALWTWGRRRSWRSAGLNAGTITAMKMARCARPPGKRFAEIEATGVNGEGAPRVPNTTSIYFDCIEGEALVIALDLKGLAVSTGAACSSGAIEPSHVLTAMGLRPERARASIRFSLGKQNTAEDVDFATRTDPGDRGALAGVVAGVARKTQLALSIQHLAKSESVKS